MKNQIDVNTNKPLCYYEYNLFAQGIKGSNTIHNTNHDIHINDNTPIVMNPFDSSVINKDIILNKELSLT